MGYSTGIGRVLKLARIDLARRHELPSVPSLFMATISAIAGSLAADACIVAIASAVLPETRGFPHFEFPDYGKLTVIGVLIACAAWPVVARVSSSPRWLFVRLAILVTLALWLPDLYILHLGELPQGVAVLMAMHLAIGIVTYLALTRIAPVREREVTGKLAQRSPEG